MPGLAIVERYLTTLTPGNLDTVFFDLPRDFAYAGLLLRARGEVDITGGITNGTLHDENPMSYIRRVIVEGTGGGQSVQLKNMRGIHFYRAAHLLTGIEPNASPVTSAAVGTPSWSCVIPIFFILPGPKLPVELAMNSILIPTEFSTVRLQIETGNDQDFVNGGDRTETVQNVSIDVIALQATNVRPLRRPWRYIEQHLFRDSVTAVATLRRLGDRLPTGRPYRYLYFRTTNEQGNVRQPVDDTLRDDIEVFVAQTLIRRYTNFREHVEQTRRDNLVRDAVNPTGLNALSNRDNPAIGHYLFDFLRDGRLESLLDTSRFPARGIEIDFRHDVATANREIDVQAGFIVPGPPVAGGRR